MMPALKFRCFSWSPSVSDTRSAQNRPTQQSNRTSGASAARNCLVCSTVSFRFSLTGVFFPMCTRSTGLRSCQWPQSIARVKIELMMLRRSSNVAGPKLLGREPSLDRPAIRYLAHHQRLKRGLDVFLKMGRDLARVDADSDPSPIDVAALIDLEEIAELDLRLNRIVRSH